jgi:hypothetical protein
VMTSGHCIRLGKILEWCFSGCTMVNICRNALL